MCKESVPNDNIIQVCGVLHSSVLNPFSCLISQDPKCEVILLIILLILS
jgi:hypothetical protein